MNCLLSFIAYMEVIKEVTPLTDSHKVFWTFKVPVNFCIFFLEIVIVSDMLSNWKPIWAASYCQYRISLSFFRDVFKVHSGYSTFNRYLQEEIFKLVQYLLTWHYWLVPEEASEVILEGGLGWGNHWLVFSPEMTEIHLLAITPCFFALVYSYPAHWSHIGLCWPKLPVLIKLT